MKKTKFVFLFLLFAPLTVFGIETKTFSDWEYVCPDKNNKNCFLSQIIMDEEGKTVMMQMIVGKIKENKFPIISFQLPPVLKSGAEINVVLQNNTSMIIQVKNCSQSRCQAYGALSPDFVKDFKASTAGIVQYQSSHDSMSKVYFSLKGFVEAFDYFEKHSEV